jgi:hypothetical protein
MAETKYSYEKECDSNRLAQEISASAIITALDRIERVTTTDIWFKDALSGGDETILSALVTAHVNTPLPDDVVKPVSISSLPAPQPFATPTYRTKLHATSSIITIAPDTSENIDFQLTQERYVSGGTLIIKDAKLGDYVTASVYDKDSVLPEAYRAALCEAWPVVGEYITKHFIEIDSDTYTNMRIDTYPLNAKIPAGFYLRITYYATDAAGDRQVGVNYHLTKKL